MSDIENNDTPVNEEQDPERVKFSKEKFNSCKLTV